MAAPVNLELSEIGKERLVLQDPSDEVFLHEKRQRLFKYAHTSDKQSVFQKELLDIKDKNQRTKLCRSSDERSNSLMHYAAKVGNLNICKFLCEQGADLNARGQNLMTPLQFAARYGDKYEAENVWTCMKWIMEEDEKNHSSKTAKKDNEIFSDGRDDITILQYAMQNTNWDRNPFVVQELIKTKKFKITDTDKQGNTCLHLAAQFDKESNNTLLEAFLPSHDKEKDYRSQDYIDWEDLEKCIVAENKLGMTPLHVACAIGNPDSVEYLLDIARNTINVSEIINSPDSNGSLPMSLAITSRNLKMVEILMKRGATVYEESIITAARYELYFYCKKEEIHPNNKKLNKPKKTSVM